MNHPRKTRRAAGEQAQPPGAGAASGRDGGAEAGALDDVDGAALLDELSRAVRRYVVLPSEHALAGVVLWIAATHGASAAHTFPRLVIRSPEKRCGKSRLLDLVLALCRKPLPTANVSAAVLYRVMGGDDPHVLLIDEADTIWGTKKATEQHEDLRGLVNAGFERGRPTYRWDPQRRKLESLQTFGFVALAGIGTLPDTITDRAVNITMRRRQVGEHVQPYRSRRDGEPLAVLRERVHRWIREHLVELEKAEPPLPVEDRAADVWQPLVAVADLAGGDWPERARAAAAELSAQHEQDDSANSDALRLLADIRDVFTTARVSFMPSKMLVSWLRLRDESPWGGADDDLTTNKLATKLRSYGIAPGRDTTGDVRGYRLDDFRDSFARYLAHHPSEGVRPSEPQVNGHAPSDSLTV